MPVLKSYTSRSGHYIHASVHGKVVTLQLTSQGFELLSGAGVQPGDRFGLQVLADLTRRGDAYTLRSGAGFHDAEQFEFAFDAEESRESEGLFPACGVTGGFDDLHLVVHGEDGSAVVQLLCGLALGEVDGKVRLCIPLPALSGRLLASLEHSGHLPEGSGVVDELRLWLLQEASTDWDRMRREKDFRQQSLGLAGDDELELG